MELLGTSAMITSSDQDFSWPVTAELQPEKIKIKAPPPRKATADSAGHRSGIGAGTLVDQQGPWGLQEKREEKSRHAQEKQSPGQRVFQR